MGTHVAPAPAIRPSRILAGLIAVALIAALALGVALATRATGFDSQTTNDSVSNYRNPAAGYPAHYGLAGPSRLGTEAGSWMGYPAHYGLAGPSRVETVAAPTSVGAGYPAHYGLAGPSQVGD